MPPLSPSLGHSSLQGSRTPTRPPSAASAAHSPYDHLVNMRRTPSLGLPLSLSQPQVTAPACCSAVHLQGAALEGSAQAGLPLLLQQPLCLQRMQAWVTAASAAAGLMSQWLQRVGLNPSSPGAFVAPAPMLLHSCGRPAGACTPLAGSGQPLLAAAAAAAGASLPAAGAVRAAGQAGQPAGWQRAHAAGAGARPAPAW